MIEKTLARIPCIAVAMLAVSCSSSSTNGPSPAEAGANEAGSSVDASAEVFTVLVQGALKSTAVASQTIHDEVAGGSRMQAQSLGDIAHDVFLNEAALAPHDGGADAGAAPLQFLGIDRWTNLAGRCRTGP